MVELATVTGPQRAFCTFRIEQRLHGIDVASVREVSPCLPITPVPQAPPSLRGLINLRSRIYLALDPRSLLGLGPCPCAPESRLIILKPDVGQDLGFLVERGGDIVHVKTELIERLGAGLESPGDPGPSMIVGACKLAGELLLIVDPKIVIEAVLRQFRSAGEAGNTAPLESVP